jgi:hypothetical protein
VISAGALTPVLVCFHKLEITPLSNFNHSRYGTKRVWYGIIDGDDTNRLLAAYPRQFRAK